jgi:hypothetical protein
MSQFAVTPMNNNFKKQGLVFALLKSKTTIELYILRGAVDKCMK